MHRTNKTKAAAIETVADETKTAQQKGAIARKPRQEKQTAASRAQLPNPSQPASAEPRPGSKTARLLALLSSEGGATIAELSEATGWQAHSVRGAMAGTLKKKGHVVSSQKQDGVRRYRLGDAA